MCRAFIWSTFYLKAKFKMICSLMKVLIFCQQSRSKSRFIFFLPLFIAPPPLCTSIHVLSHFSHVWLFATCWTVALQAPLSMGFSRPEYWSGFSFPSPGNLPNPGIRSTFLMSHCIGRQVLYPCCHLGGPSASTVYTNSWHFSAHFPSVFYNFSLRLNTLLLINYCSLLIDLTFRFFFTSQSFLQVGS